MSTEEQQAIKNERRRIRDAQRRQNMSEHLSSGNNSPHHCNSPHKQKASSFIGFYDGIVSEYDYFREKHLILYTDGVKEVLNLRAQRWELTEEENNTPTEPALEVNMATPDLASANDMMKTLAANPEDQSTTNATNLNTTEPANTKGTPDVNLTESCGLETLSKVAGEQ